MDRSLSDTTIEDFLDGVQERIEGGEALPLSSRLSDRKLASIAWPEGPPDGYGKSWSDLSPGACGEAIDRQLTSAPQSDS